MITRADQIRGDIEAISRRHGLSVKDIIQHGRHRHIVAARDEIAWTLREKWGLSFSRMSVYMKRDHTTLIQAVGRHHLKLGDVDHPMAAYVARKRQQSRDRSRARGKGAVA